MKTCPYCAEEIQSEAIKCKHCQEFLDGSGATRTAAKKLPWYFQTPALVLAFLTVGPLALPLIWWHPKLSPVWKIVLSLLVLLITWMLYLASLEAFKFLKELESTLQGVTAF